MAEGGKTNAADLLSQIEEELLKLTVEDLNKFGEYIKIHKEKYDSTSKLKVLRVIRSKMEEIKEQENPSEFLEDIQECFTKEPPDLEGETGKGETTDNSDKKTRTKQR